MSRKRRPVQAAESGSTPVEAVAGSGPAAAVDTGADAGAELGRGFPIVGIGASAGGLGAFEAFFSGMPAGAAPGMAFVLVQHLAPDHKSILTDLVKRYTRMEVFEVEDGMAVRPNCAYIIPPNRDMALLHGRLQLLEPSAPRGMRLPIDFFFRSLAEDQHERAICIVLSGSGSDGTLGARAVKAEGGLVLAQSLGSAQYDGMPRSAIATGMVDYVLPPDEMPDRLAAYAAHAFGSTPRPAPSPTPAAEDAMKRVCAVLLDQTGHDFSQYKQHTLVRRVDRRMAIHQLERPDEYLRYLRQTPAEGQALFRDMLIGVTSFFRDPEAFAALEVEVIPRLLAAKHSGAPVRTWVCGCCTGEEAYSVAILLREHLERSDHAVKLQVFATDLDGSAIVQARAGLYPTNIAADVSPERLARFFTQEPEGGGYRIQKGIRDLVVFSEQDVIRDPPFSRMDLICFRNVLIYMNPELQQGLISLFHYALNPGGVLFLGPSETVGDSASRFAALDRKWKLYERREDGAGAPHPALGGFTPPLPGPASRRREERHNGPMGSETSLRAAVEQALLAHYAQAGVLVDGRGEVLHIYGRTGRYLEPAAGDARLNILLMAREGLRRPLSAALQRAVTRNEPVRCAGLRIQTDGELVTANLVVRPATPPGGPPLPDHFLVILEETPPVLPPAAAEAPPPAPSGAAPPAAEADSRLAALEQELRDKDAYLQATLEEMGTANGELLSANEELQSVNEELQSTNEELETSKEELQSVNEELTTVNNELQTRVADLSRANNDMNNLLAGTGVATIFVDSQLRIARFTPTATQLINLIPTDVGRPVAHIVSNLVGYDRLVEDVELVLGDLTPRETTVRTRGGAWFSLRIRPYRTLENVIDGAVITFVDISDLKRASDAVLGAHTLAERVVDAVREPLLVLDAGQTVVSANGAFYRAFGMEPGEAAGHNLFEMDGGQWDTADLRRLLFEDLPAKSVVDGFRVIQEFPRIGRRVLLLNARRIVRPSGEGEVILLAIEDVTGGAA